ncbi:MAG: bifunctional UDP-N-acetylglucosamine diphosphorylase/glucosamine-1-phosphate N-acetyltransferase GlmU [Paracoccaceae bacterium]
MSDTADLSLIVLAAGQGTRMNSDLPKVLHKVGAAPLLHHALSAGRSIAPSRIVVVTGHGSAAVGKAAQDFDPEILLVEQSERKGTAHAVACAAEVLTQATGNALVLYGDTPFVSSNTLLAMRDAAIHCDIVVLGFETPYPGHYGRLITSGDRLEAIVEYKDASPAQRAINLCNSGVIYAGKATLFDLISQIGCDNEAGEFYLTDIVKLANDVGKSAGFVICDAFETQGINTRAELAMAEASFQKRARHGALDNGVTLTAPETVYFALDTFIGRDTVVGPHVIFGPNVTVESEVEIKGFCHLEGCHISRGGQVGPFARLRPGAELADDVHIGNFVEIKNAILDEGVKVGHLTYLGDAHVGEFTNIGAGTITCNYDGVNKHRTTIGARAFIGSNTMLVAPVRVGDDTMTGSGSVITKEVADQALALGRAVQINKPGLAVKLMQLYRAAKAARLKG